MIARSPSTWSVRSTSGGPSVSWTAATLVPMASIANTGRPPSTSTKYFRSRGTSAEGVYRKSSRSNGGADSATAGRGPGHVTQDSLGARSAEGGFVDRDDALQRLRSARVGRIATVTPDDRPHVVPFVFALVEGPGGEPRAYWAVDRKPKRSGRLQRLRNLEGN